MNRYLSIFLVILLSIASSLLHAQLQTAHWYFGANAGVDFTSGTPVADTNGQIYTNEGCTSISDEYGNLLFYSDGITIYDRNHNIMPNGTGLYGHTSSTQSAIAVPMPGECHLYYLFTIAANDGANRGLCYSVIDITLNDGYGDIVATQKNINVVDYVSEKLTAIANADRTGYWIVTHYINRFYAIPVTDNGVGSNAVVSNNTLINTTSVGYLKTSPDGSKLAMAYHDISSSLSVYDFDTATGVVSNLEYISSRNFYGVEFSPNGQLLYASTSNNSVYQYNLNSSPISDSEFLLYQGSEHSQGALQMGLDGNIYRVVYDGDHLDKIENPNIAYNAETGEAPVYIQNAVPLFNNSRFGLPQFPNYYIRAVSLITTINGESNAGVYCKGNLEFALEFAFCSAGGIIESIHWDFDDGNTSTEENPTHTYDQPGTYVITLILIVDGEEYIRTLEIEIIGVSAEDAVLETCDTGEDFTFDLDSAYPQINPNGEDVIITFHSSPENAENGINPFQGDYTANTNTTLWVRAEHDAGCHDVSQLDLIFLPVITPVLNSPMEICEGNSIELNVITEVEAAVNWYENEDTAEILHTGSSYTTPELTENTTYWVETVNTGINGLECTSERLPYAVIVNPAPGLSINPMQEACEGYPVELTAIVEQGTIVYWYDEEEAEIPVYTGETYLIPGLTDSTIYWVEAVSEQECKSDRFPIEITVYSLPEINTETPNPAICIGDIIVLEVETDGEMVYWYNSEDATEPVFTGNPYEIEGLTQTTTFWVEAGSEENCRSIRESITVTVNPLPELTIENEEPEICMGETIILEVETNGNMVYWYDSQDGTEPVYTGNPYEIEDLGETTTFWVKTEDSETGCISERQEITVTVNPQPEIALENPTAEICLGEILEITVITNAETVLWYDAENAVTPIFTGNPYTNENTTESTILWVEAVNEESCASERLEIGVVVNPLPELIIEDESPEICAGEEVILQANSTGNIIYWYNEQDAETPVYTGEIYEIPGLTATTVFWVEAFNSITGCTSIRESIPVTVNPVPELQDDEIYFCDSLNDSEEHVDLTQSNITNDPDLELIYFASENDFINNSPIDNPAHFLIDSSQGVVYVSAAAGNGCPAYAELTVVLTEAPAVSDTSLEICTPADGFGTYNLSHANAQIIDNPQNYGITYHLNYENAKDGINPLPETYENSLVNQMIFARVEEGENCFNIAEVLLTFNETFIHLSEPLEECDEDRDGSAVFNLTEKEPEISAIFGGSDYIIIIYYESLEDAYNNIGEIPNQESYTNESNPQTVYAKVYNGDICLGIVSFDLIAVQPPVVEVETHITLCPGENYTIEAPPGYESYTWTSPGGIVISTTNSAILDTEGIYTLEITFADNICVFREEIEVVFDNSPVVTNIEVNGTTVIITATGTEPLEYSIDGGQTWQNPNVFYDVPYGEYEIMVKNGNSCESGLYPIVVFEIMNVITPNNDSYNDTWIIPALVNYPGATLKIVDRYGKLLVSTEVENGYVWDGKYAGNPLPSTSYWYVLDLGNGQKITGVVTLKNY